MKPFGKNLSLPSLWLVANQRGRRQAQESATHGLSPPHGSPSPPHLTNNMSGNGATRAPTQPQANTETQRADTGTTEADVPGAGSVRRWTDSSARYRQCRSGGRQLMANELGMRSNRTLQWSRGFLSETRVASPRERGSYSKPAKSVKRMMIQIFFCLQLQHLLPPSFAPTPQPQSGLNVTFPVRQPFPS
jgi:hypothetical protein